MSQNVDSKEQSSLVQPITASVLGKDGPHVLLCLKQVVRLLPFSLQLASAAFWPVKTRGSRLAVENSK